MAKVKVKREKKEYVVFFVYMGGDRKNNKEIIESEMDENIIAKILVIGDFNARIGEETEAGIIGESIVRKAKDKEVNSEGKVLISWLKENELIVLN